MPLSIIVALAFSIIWANAMEQRFPELDIFAFIDDRTLQATGDNALDQVRQCAGHSEIIDDALNIATSLTKSSIGVVRKQDL